MAIQVAVVGMGSRGQHWIREIRNSSQFELTACVDTDRHALESAQKKMAVPGASCFSDLNRALDRDGVDAVLVATSADSHFEPCDEAMIGCTRAIHYAQPRCIG